MRMRRRRSGEPPGPRFSTVLRRLGEGESERIGVAELVDTFADRAFGALMFIFAVPNVIPLPPGSSGFFAVPLILIAAQLAMGRQTLWLPSPLLRLSIKRDDYARMLERVLPALRRAERLLAPRLGIMFGILGDRLIGICCLVMAIVLFLPIPLANMVPGLSISAFALGLMQRDGIAVVIGWIAALGTAGIVALVSGAAWIAIKAFFHALLGIV